MTEVNVLFDIPYHQLKNHPLKNTFTTKYNGDWIETSTQEYIDKANALSRTLLDLGIKPNDKIAIITNRNRTEWHITDIGIMQLGAQTVPIYDSTSKIELEYIFNHAEVKFCFVATETLYNKVSEISSKIPTLKKIISFDIIPNKTSLNDLVEIGNNLRNQIEVDAIKKTVKSSDLATIIYTSGTTDKPKGVMLSHSNIISNIDACLSIIPVFKNNVNSLSFLPVSHIFERVILYIYQVSGISIYFAESMETIPADLAYVKPHILTVVPRLLEKIHDKIIEKGNELSSIKKRIFNWAIKIGYDFEPYGQNGKSYERDLYRARKLIFKKWKEVFGGNVEAMYCGSAKLQTRLVRIYNAAGIPVFDGYGLTETSPVISVNTPFENGLKIGTIGKPVKNVEVIIAEDGEILSKGPNNMLGYYKNEEKTEASFVNGYFKTGDLGKIDDDGFLYITGRKKETFKTSGGKYITPTKIESELRKSLFIEQLVVIGESEKMPAAIIQPNFDLLKDFIGLSDIANDVLIKNEKALSKIQSEIDFVNEELGQWEKIKRFELTPDTWTVDDGHLTPTMKVKRDIIKSKYYILYNKIYRSHS